MGRQYQEHLKQMFDAPAKAPQVRAQMIQAQKDRPYQTEAMVLGRQNTAEQTALAIRRYAIERTALNL